MASSDTVQFTAAVALRRAAAYRERAAQLAKMAQAEPLACVSVLLADRAKRWERWADDVEIPRSR